MAKALDRPDVSVPACTYEFRAHGGQARHRLSSKTLSCIHVRFGYADKNTYLCVGFVIPLGLNADYNTSVIPARTIKEFALCLRQRMIKWSLRQVTYVWIQQRPSGGREQ